MSTDDAHDRERETPRARRSDATRNRDRLVAAARELFDRQGVNSPLDDVARLAHVGNATMYRHFPTRRELLVAVYADEVETLIERGQAMLEDDPPGLALFAWLHSFILHVASRRDLALAIPDDQSERRSELFDQWHDQMRSTVGRLLTRAQEVGTLRTDVAVDDLLGLANGIALVTRDPDRIERLLVVVRQGVQR